MNYLFKNSVLNGCHFPKEFEGFVWKYIYQIFFEFIMKKL